MVQGLLQDLGHLTPQQIDQAINHLANWLTQDDPLGFLLSLQTGQVLNLLAQVAPVIAQWLAENMGLMGAGGYQGRRGGGSLVRNFGGLAAQVAGIVGSTLGPGTGGWYGVNPYGWSGVQPPFQPGVQPTVPE